MLQKNLKRWSEMIKVEQEEKLLHCGGNVEHQKI